jgi:hypothetical protein
VPTLVTSPTASTRIRFSLSHPVTFGGRRLRGFRGDLRRLASTAEAPDGEALRADEARGHDSGNRRMLTGDEAGRPGVRL